MEGIFQSLAGMGPLKLIGGILFVLLIIAVIKGFNGPSDKNNGGNSGKSNGSGNNSTTPPSTPTQQ